MIIHPLNAPLPYLRNSSSNLDPMSCPLTHPYSQPRWHYGILLQHSFGAWHDISMRELYAYKLSIRTALNPVLEICKLTQQYIIDQWVKIEHQRLQCLRENQRQLRVDWYHGLNDLDQWHQNLQNQQNLGDAAAGIPIVVINSPRFARKYEVALSGSQCHCDQVW